MDRKQFQKNILSIVQELKKETLDNEILSRINDLEQSLLEDINQPIEQLIKEQEEILEYCKKGLEYVLIDEEFRTRWLENSEFNTLEKLINFFNKRIKEEQDILDRYKSGNKE